MPILILVFVGIAFFVAVIVLILNKYLDLRVVAYTADASRQATNLIHSILASNCTGAVEKKLVLDFYRLKEVPLDECENLEYDYNFSVTRIGDGYSKKIEKLVFNFDDQCYLSYQRIKGYVEMPVVLHYEPTREEGNYRAGIAKLTLMKTPLSELAFWISQASLRIKEGHDEEIIKSIRVGPEVIRIKIENGKICMNVKNVPNEVCKQLFLDSTAKVCRRKVSVDVILDPKFPTTDKDFKCNEEYDLPTYLELDKKCKMINIYANATDNEVKIIIPVSR